jgi:hypothetical protein
MINFGHAAHHPNSTVGRRQGPVRGRADIPHLPDTAQLYLNAICKFTVRFLQICERNSDCFRAFSGYMATAMVASVGWLLLVPRRVS